MDCHSLLQRIFLTQGSNPGLLNCMQILSRLSYREVLGDMKEPELKEMESPYGVLGRRRLEAGFLPGQRNVGVAAWTLALPLSTHLGLASHWVVCPGRWPIPGIAAAQRGGPSYFVDTRNQVWLDEKCLSH